MKTGLVSRCGFRDREANEMFFSNPDEKMKS